MNNETLAVAQINLISGDLEYNSKKIAEYIKLAEKNGIKTLIFPELTLTGYCLENTVCRHKFLLKENIKWLDALAKLTTSTKVLVGFIDEINSQIVNSVAVLEQGKIQNKIASSNFPQKIKHEENEILVCFSEKDINLSQNIPVICVNKVGATDNFSYKGESKIYNSEGKLIKIGKTCEEDFITINLSDKTYKEILLHRKDLAQNFSLNYENELELIYKTLIQGIKDYFNKCGIKRAVLGLSGGLDSTVCAVLLADALGKENVLGVSMPSKLTSQESKSDAKELADNLKIHFIEHPIKPLTDSTNECFDKMFAELETSFGQRYKKSYTQDNIQARARAMFLWGISNEFASCIPIATSDKSETYMGYATINGDMSGGFAPIADVTKTKLFALARWMNENRAVKYCIPNSIIEKRPGAELAIDERTGKTLLAEDALMPYEFLDEIIWRVENKNETYDNMLNSEFIYEKAHNISLKQKTEWLEKFFKRMSSALYKWSILPPAVILDEKTTINKSVYSQPITSGKINYKGHSKEETQSILNSD